MTNKICGIVAEYNPFHNGHAYHLAQSRLVSGAGFVVVVLSGNFVQRGEPAITHKFSRTRAALLGGADLVLELPVNFATSSAEGFASGAVQILAKTGIVTDICFGAETTDLQILKKIASALVNETPEFKAFLKQGLAKGFSFPRARAAALEQTFDNIISYIDKIVNSPNNILGIEYLKALKRLGSDIIPHAIARKGAQHHDTTPSGIYASATSLRREILADNMKILENLMPRDSFELLLKERGEGAINQMDNFSGFFHYLLASGQADTNPQLRRAAQNHYNLLDVINAAKAKNITHTALKRAALRTVLNLHDYDAPQYIRVLGFKRDSAHLLREMEKKADLPIITNLKNAPPSDMLAQEINSTQLYWLALKHLGVAERREMSAPMVIV
ncbi:MAG: nucleotidyltransferase family protein [Defluviitaleaceae bacterium]|nr:nucleotidyltransferase family protein [Defluviitaleaceae bacterium]